MSHFLEIIKKVELVTAYIGKKAKDNIDIIKISNDYNKEIKQLNLLYKELGKESYEMYNGKTHNIDRIETLYNQLKEQIKAVNQLEKQIDNIKYEAEVIEITKESEAIEEMKEKFINDSIPKPEAGKDGFLLLKFCPNCQIGNNPDAKQCISCAHIF